MVDFVNPEYFKMGEMSLETAKDVVSHLLIEGEEVVSGFKTLRDKVVFTNRRIIAINVQGVTGKKIAYTSIPYSKIQTYSIETAGNFDMDSELDVWISSVGKIHFEISGGYDIKELNQIGRAHV